MKCPRVKRMKKKKNLLIPGAGWRVLVLFPHEYGCRMKTMALDRGAGTGNDREEICCPSDRARGFSPSKSMPETSGKEPQTLSRNCNHRGRNL